MEAQRLVAVRTLYLVLLASGLLFLLLIWWSAPAARAARIATSTPTPVLQKVRLSAPIPAGGIAPGAEIMAFYPNAGVTVKASQCSIAHGQLELECEVPEQAATSPPTELWSSQGSRWRQNSGGLLEVAPVSSGGKARDLESYRPPAPTARPPRLAAKATQLPPGVNPPAGFKQMSSDELIQRREQYRARK